MPDRSSPLDANSASHNKLVDLPGVGAAMVDRIIAARPFDSIEITNEYTVTPSLTMTPYHKNSSMIHVDNRFCGKIKG